MWMSLRINMFLIAFITFIFVIRKVKSNTIHIKDTVVWILWTALLLVLAVFPNILLWISNLLGIELLSNTVFFMVIGFLYVALFLLSQKLSLQEEKIKNLSQEIGLLKKQIKDKEL